MINNKYLKNIYYLTIFLINSLLIFCLIFKSHGITLGWDTQFHINRIEEIVKSLENGHLLPSHGTYAFSYIGLAVNYFYPYLFLYPFAILEILFNPLFGYNVTLLLMTFIGFIISYLTIKKLNFGDEQYSDPIAFWFSILYNNSSYIIFQSTLRGDIGEFIALILLPIVFLGFQMLYDKNTNLWVLLP